MPEIRRVKEPRGRRSSDPQSHGPDDNEPPGQNLNQNPIEAEALSPTENEPTAHSSSENEPRANTSNENEPQVTRSKNILDFVIPTVKGPHAGEKYEPLPWLDLGDTKKKKSPYKTHRVDSFTTEYRFRDGRKVENWSSLHLAGREYRYPTPKPCMPTLFDENPKKKKQKVNRPKTPCHLINRVIRPKKPIIYPYRLKNEPEDPATSPRYRAIRRRWGAYDERVLVVRSDQIPDAKIHFERIKNAMKRRYSFIVIEQKEISGPVCNRINIGNWLHHIAVKGSYFTAFMLYFWPHLRWTWMPSFVLASVAFFGYNFIWIQFPAFNYAILSPKHPIIKRLPMKKLPSGKGTVLQLNYNSFRNWHQRSIYSWCLYKFIHYHKAPPPPCLNHWPCIEGIPYYAKQYGFLEPPIEDAPKYDRLAY